MHSIRLQSREVYSRLRQLVIVSKFPCLMMYSKTKVDRILTANSTLASR